MTDPAWVRRAPEGGDTAVAAGAALVVAAGTAALTFWLVRTLAARDPVELRPAHAPPTEEERGRLP